MFRIREGQLYALAAGMRLQLARRLAQHLRRAFPDGAAAVAPHELTARALDVVAAGERLGIRSSQAFHRLANLHAALGWDFAEKPEHAWIAAWLRDEQRGAPDERLASLMKRLLFVRAIGAQP